MDLNTEARKNHKQSGSNKFLAFPSVVCLVFPTISNESFFSLSFHPSDQSIAVYQTSEDVRYPFNTFSLVVSLLHGSIRFTIVVQQLLISKAIFIGFQNCYNTLTDILGRIKSKFTYNCVVVGKSHKT